MRWLALATAWAGNPSAEDLERDWERWRSALDRHAVYPLSFEDDEWQRVAEGKVLRRRDRLEGTDRVLGMVWVPADLDTTWLGVHDPHGEVVDGFVDEELPGSTFSKRLVYQSIQLPWPLVPRQWVILVQNNAALSEATGGKVWERTWDLDDRRGARSELPKGVWLPVNEGGWTYAEAAGGTLVLYHVRTVVGGIVPDEAATRWSFSTLTGMLERVVERSRWARTHYVAGHEPLMRPGETEIPRFVEDAHDVADPDPGLQR